jgi:hypothetical protein
MTLQTVTDKSLEIKNNIKKVIIGKDNEIDLIMCF